VGPRFTNAALLVLAGTLTLTGVFGLFSQLSGFALDLHRVAAWMLVVLLPWKALISYRSLRRGPARSWDRSVVLLVSIALGAASLAVVVWSIGWMWRIGADTVRLAGYRDTAIAWHWMVGLATLPALALHAWRRWPRRGNRTCFRGAAFCGRPPSARPACSYGAPESLLRDCVRRESW